MQFGVLESVGGRNQLHLLGFRVSVSLSRIRAGQSTAISVGNCDPLDLIMFKCISYCFCLWVKKPHLPVVREITQAIHKDHV